MQCFDYNLKELKMLMVAVPIAIVLAFVTDRHVPWWFWLLVFSWMAIWRLLPVARVYVDDSSLTVEYFLPFRRSHRLAFDNLLGYQPISLKIRGRVISVMGRLHPKSGKPIAIWETGTKGFAQLSDALIQRLPLYEARAA